MYEFVDTTESPEGSAWLPSEALQINGEYIENMIDGYRTLTVSGREAMTQEIETYGIGVRDGEKFKSRRYPARTITVTYRMMADSAEDFREKYNLLGSILNVQEAELIFADEPDKYFTGTPTEIGEVEPGRNAVTGEIQFYCADPFKYSVIEYEAEPELEEGSILIDYGGTYKSYPVLEADFYSEDEASEDGETVSALTGNGDCGYVAFFNEDERIIQLGDPEEVDGEVAYAKSQTLINQKFMSTSAWGSAAKNLWTANNGAVLPSSVVQAGSMGMQVASYAVPASPKATSGTLLKNKMTSSGSPRFYYTVTAKTSGRTASSVKVSVAITASLKTASNYFGRGYGLRGSIYMGGSWHNVTIKKTSAYWKGKSGHTVNLSFTVSGLSNTTKSLTGIKFKVTRTDSLGNAGILGETSCSNLAISDYVADVPETYALGASGYGSASGKWHGPSISRSIPADAAGEAGAANFSLTYKQKMCIGNGKKDTNQLGAFQVQLSDSSGKVIAGVRIRKSQAGKTGNIDYYVNGSVVKTTSVDLSYNNKNFGSKESSVKTSMIEKTGNKIVFSIGGTKYTFTEDAVKDIKATKITFMLEQYSSSAALSYNGLYWVKFVKNNCNTMRDIPNKFSADDVVEADCKNAEILLNGTPAPSLGALGNDWENFYLTPGLNQIGIAYSEWVSAECAPQFKVKYREVFL